MNLMLSDTQPVVDLLHAAIQHSIDEHFAIVVREDASICPDSIVCFVGADVMRKIEAAGAAIAAAEMLTHAARKPT